MIQVRKDRYWDDTGFINLQKQNKRPLITKQVQKQLNVDWMYLDNGKYNNDNWKYVFERMKKSKARRLILQKNDRPTLIKELSNINFVSLNVLNLKSNKINSIEALSFIYFPNLQWLYLGIFSDKKDNNNIISLKPLVKSKFSQLKKLHFNQNRIKQICASKFDLGKCFMSFQAQISSMNRISQEDLSFLVKLSPSSIKSITFCGKRRIKQPEVYNAIQNRFNQIHFYDTNLEMIYNRPIFL